MFQGAEMLFTVHAVISERSSDFICVSPKLEEGKKTQNQPSALKCLQLLLDK